MSASRQFRDPYNQGSCSDQCVLLEGSEAVGRECWPNKHVSSPSSNVPLNHVYCSHNLHTIGFGAQHSSVRPGVARHGNSASRHEIACIRMTAFEPVFAFAVATFTGGLLWALAVVILEISCGVKLVLQKHVERPFQREDNGVALDLMRLLRHVFVLLPLTVFLAYAAWIVEAAAICLTGGVVAAYYFMLQRIWPEGSVLACLVLSSLVFLSYDAYFQHQVASRIRQRFASS